MSTLHLHMQPSKSKTSEINKSLLDRREVHVSICECERVYEELGAERFVNFTRSEKRYSGRDPDWELRSCVLCQT